MSYEIAIVGEDDADAETVRPLATNTGWRDFVAWALTLPDEDYPDLIHLCVFGWAEDAAVVAAQALHAVEAYETDSEEVASTGRHLAAMLADAGPDDAAVVVH